ncbi:hypothetical protein AB0L82_36240 [Nocardia sp. NPDC052001]|uniref:hypothetical protein n=1 Tax=Nocardia sp. NPDC052001 TaxID=3154853 RepID=UPI003421FC8A
MAEIAHDFVRDERGTKRLNDIAIRSVDERSFERLLEAAVVNFFRDLARRTDLGKLILRVKEILRDEPNFVPVAGATDRWTVREGLHTASIVPGSVLEAAISSIAVVVPRWSSDRRDAPAADRESFIRLMYTVLEAADGSLTAAELARTITTRLDHRRVPLTVSLDAGEHAAEPMLAGDDPAARTVADLHATYIFNGMGDRERIAMTLLEGSVRDLATRLDIGKSQAATVRQRLVAHLQDELGDDEDPGRTAGVLSQLCEDWIEDRTKQSAATSDNHEIIERGGKS